MGDKNYDDKYSKKFREAYSECIVSFANLLETCANLIESPPVFHDVDHIFHRNEEQENLVAKRHFTQRQNLIKEIGETEIKIDTEKKLAEVVNEMREKYMNKGMDKDQVDKDVDEFLENILVTKRNRELSQINNVEKDAMVAVVAEAEELAAEEPAAEEPAAEELAAEIGSKRGLNSGSDDEEKRETKKKPKGTKADASAVAPPGASTVAPPGAPPGAPLGDSVVALPSDEEEERETHKKSKYEKVDASTVAPPGASRVAPPGAPPGAPLDDSKVSLSSLMGKRERHPGSDKEQVEPKMFKKGDQNGGAVVEGNMFVANKDWPGEDEVSFENFLKISKNDLIVVTEVFGPGTAYEGYLKGYVDDEGEVEVGVFPVDQVGELLDKEDLEILKKAEEDTITPTLFYYLAEIAENTINMIYQINETHRGCARPPEFSRDIKTTARHILEELRRGMKKLGQIDQQPPELPEGVDNRDIITAYQKAFRKALLTETGRGDQEATPEYFQDFHYPNDEADIHVFLKQLMVFATQCNKAMETASANTVSMMIETLREKMMAEMKDDAETDEAVEEMRQRFSKHVSGGLIEKGDGIAVLERLGLMEDDLQTRDTIIEAIKKNSRTVTKAAMAIEARI